ncbi:MAG: DUF512 domain-containing protein [Coprococcus catus]|nr:DUF512 domain-containing protein [Coprococcus catus]
MKKHLHVIQSIVPGSIAEEMELQPGDTVLAINGQDIEDVFDYHYLVNDEYIEMLIRTANGTEEVLEIEKDYDEDIGIVFESSLMDDYRSCSNNCIFCFIDQLPKGMRETMYFKDDDSRLSFLQGNYITMTNMKDEALERIIRYKLEPINVSVHTTNPELRCMMLHNRFAGKIMEQLQKLYEGGIIMNGQIVLCKNVNDGEELERSIRDLSSFIPNIESVSVVPVGLSDHREGLYPLEPFNREDAREVIACIEKWQKKLYEEYGTHFIHASDEWYLLAGYEMPEEERYDGYLQLENGVGMIRLLTEEFHEGLKEAVTDGKKRHVTIATGHSAVGTIRKLAEELCEKFPNVTVDVYEIVNHFFGEQITVSGLMTGTDLKEQLQGKDLGETLLLPVNILRSGEDVQILLDDITIPELENTLQIPISIVQSNGQDLVDKILGRGEIDE